MMENDVSKEIARELLETIKQTKDFVLEQAPGVVKQILYFGAAESILAIVLFMLLLYLSKKAVFEWAPQETDGWGDWRVEKIVAAFTSGALLLFSIVPFLTYTFKLIKILVAPKLYIIEYLSRLL